MIAPRFSAKVRSRTVEAMDAEPAGYDDFAGCVRDIARINASTNAYAPTLAWLTSVVRRCGPFSDARPLRVLDVGSGYGDTLRAIERWATRSQIAVSLTGVDLNPWAARAAAAATPKASRIRYVTADAFALGDGFASDVVVSSLFTHHLDDDGLVAFLRWSSANARLGWFVNDLHRHVLPYAFIAAATRFARMHRFVRNDAPLSVARAFRRHDWDRALAAASVRDATVRWHPFFRYCVTWERDALGTADA